MDSVPPPSPQHPLAPPPPAAVIASPPRMPRPARPLISLVVPVLNECTAIDRFIGAVDAALRDLPVRCEIIFIDDGSSDETWSVIRRAAGSDDRLRCLRLARNHGKEAALTAGLDHARGDAVIPMDVDLQDPPALVPEMIERWRDGFDVVNARRADRSGDGWVKRSTARLFYATFNILSPTVKLIPDVGDFRLLDRRVVDTLRSIRERNRFMKGIFAWVGFAMTTVDYQRPARRDGASKWSTLRLVGLAMDGIFGFSPVPLRIMLLVGLIMTLLAFAYGAWLVARTLIFGIDVAGYASLMTALLFLGGMQIAAIALVGEYVGRILTETQARPIYIVSETVGLPAAEAGDR